MRRERIAVVEFIFLILRQERSYMRRIETWIDKYLKFEWNDKTKQFTTHKKQGETK